MYSLLHSILIIKFSQSDCSGIMINLLYLFVLIDPLVFLTWLLSISIQLRISYIATLTMLILSNLLHLIFFFKQKPAYEMIWWLKFRRVLFRSEARVSPSGLKLMLCIAPFLLSPKSFVSFPVPASLRLNNPMSEATAIVLPSGEMSKQVMAPCRLSLTFQERQRDV